MTVEHLSSSLAIATSPTATARTSVARPTLADDLPRPRREPQWRMSKVDVREAALLEKLIGMGIEPGKLPTPTPPAIGLKTKLYEQLASNELFATRRSFERCWQHMRQKGILRYAEEAHTGFRHSQSSLLDPL